MKNSSNRPIFPTFVCMEGSADKIFEVLKRYWGFTEFRPVQERIIRSAMAGRDTLALMPTGGGKSLTYQVPGLAQPGLCIVVTPLIALMKDQVDRLRARRIPAVAIHSGLSPRQIDIALDNCVYGDVKFLYVAPERLATEAFRLRVERMKVSLLAVDEAHCISQWGYDFRPSYLRIAELREKLPGVPVLALTASATKLVAEDIMRHLRFQYPTFMLSTPQFEIDEEGQPWWIAPRIIKTIGLFGGTNIKGAVLCNAITGESQYYEEVPAWVDNVYTPDLIMEQYDYHGTLINGFINSVLGQRDVTVTTQGYNYIALNDDVYMYTGVTSANADQSNLGFLLSNQRTKETRFYNAPGATERAAQASAEGVVQDLGYTATFPILLNIANEPTYFIPLKDAANLVKSYAMVNVARYDIVATGSSVTQCEQEYIRMLSDKGVTQPEELPQTTASGSVAEIRSAVLEGNTYYFIRLEQESVFYALSAAQNPLAVILNPGDRVTITHAASDTPASILDGYTLTVDGKAQSQASLPTPQEEEPAPESETAPAA